MKVTILLFGQLTDIARADTVTLEDINDTDGLMARLNKSYPELTRSKYIVAVNKKVISGNTFLTNNCTVALLPPFSGG